MISNRRPTHSRKLAILCAALTPALFLYPTAQVASADPQPAVAASDQKDPAAQAQAEIQKGLGWLKQKQNPDHSWGKELDPPALTALALKAFVQSGVDPDTDFVDKGFDKLLDFQKTNGGIYRDMLANYNTAIAISALASASNEQEYKEPLRKAVQYLKDAQWNDKVEGVAEGKQPVPESDPRFGGFGYGGPKKSRPDGSNVNFALNALHDAGVKPDDPAYQDAMKFVTRLQNLSETNKDSPWAGDDGGFIYSPVNGGMSPAGEYTDASGKHMLRSYGSMTYAGLKSMIYAGLSKDDPRVKGAWGWISRNWTLEGNPGMKDNEPDSADFGLYYYYHTLARALHAYGEPIITDAHGNKHDWRLELIAKLASTQHPDGLWVNDNKKWMEDNAVLTTEFAVLALQEAVADLKDHPVK